MLMRGFKTQNTLLQWCRHPAASSPRRWRGRHGDVCRPVCLSVHFLSVSVCPVGGGPTLQWVEPETETPSAVKASANTILLNSLRLRSREDAIL